MHLQVPRQGGGPVGTNSLPAVPGCPGGSLSAMWRCSPVPGGAAVLVLYGLRPAPWFVILRMYLPHPAVMEAKWECPGIAPLT